jgi:hypothetical protein
MSRYLWLCLIPVLMACSGCKVMRSLGLGIEYVGDYNVRQFKEPAFKDERWHKDKEPRMVAPRIYQQDVPMGTAEHTASKHMQIAGHGNRHLTRGLLRAAERQQRDVDRPFRWSAEKRQEQYLREMAADRDAAAEHQSRMERTGTWKSPEEVEE